MPTDSLTSEASLVLPDDAGPSPELARWLRLQTPARVGLRRAGFSLATLEVLDFQLAHARARDAVHLPMQPTAVLAALRELPHGAAPLLLHSKAADRRQYLQRPDLGRTLDEASLGKLETAALHMSSSAPCDLVFVVADGLSALAAERHALPLLVELHRLFAEVEPELRIGPTSVVEQARVAIGDEIAHALGASMVIVLIGERPGLSSPDSLGAYITWNAQPGRTTDAERNCISNIRGEGLSYPEAAGRLLHYIREARSRRVTGVTLKDPAESLRLTTAADNSADREAT